MREIREILGEEKYDIQSMKEAGIDVDIVEDGTTFEENSLIKARAIAKEATDAIVLADGGHDDRIVTRSERIVVVGQVILVVLNLINIVLLVDRRHDRC